LATNTHATTHAFFVDENIHQIQTNFLKVLLSTKNNDKQYLWGVKFAALIACG
jgi:hypothetical protein